MYHLTYSQQTDEPIKHHIPDYQRILAVVACQEQNQSIVELNLLTNGDVHNFLGSLPQLQYNKGNDSAHMIQTTIDFKQVLPQYSMWNILKKTESLPSKKSSLKWVHHT